MSDVQAIISKLKALQHYELNEDRVEMEEADNEHGWWASLDDIQEIIDEFEGKE